MQTEPTAPTWDFLSDAVPAAPSRLGDVMLERLTQAIVDGRFKPGDALPSESQLAAAFNVSKPVARDALRELAALGVVQVQQGKVSRIRALDGGPLQRFYRLAIGGGQKRLLEAVQLRRILETPIARLAAENRTAADLAVLAGLLQQMEQSRGDAQRWIEADQAFHNHLARMTQNQLLVLQMHGLELLIQQMMVRFNAYQATAGRDWDATLARHRRIADAVIAGDGEAAQVAMEAHFAAADRAVESIFGGPSAGQQAAARKPARRPAKPAALPAAARRRQAR